jgi:hypothetical protein
MGLATYWAIFSQTHPVTLLVRYTEEIRGRQYDLGKKTGANPTIVSYISGVVKILQFL